MNDEEKEIIERIQQDSTFRERNLLRIIEKQQAEIEDCKKCILRDEVHNYIEELEKKDKIIHLMAEKLNQAYFEEDDFEEWFEKMLGVQKQIDYGYVVDLIKQYFERRIEQ